MRLTKLKLAGFKSFVDPTTIALPGQLVGVVGPNGCGKSNVMDAVRWVLGESKASELRGESMMDVIFNGSGNRKPVSRASVELIFDNSLGRIAGQWSQYTELSVKRLLTRSGQSEYYINNLHVRRKDITDLFLGTGLGPRAYAIIGQGMIARIIEAKPEELRVFLEEAAGVTKYKERRKETEGRIADTRENLLRIEDIRLELGARMERLEAQAAVARQYQGLHAELTQKQQLLWLLRRNEAQAERERVAREVERAALDLEAQTAALRETEARLEEAREAHFSGSDGLHQAQGELFAVNAEVARLEAEIRHRREAQTQLQARLAQLDGEQRHWQAQAEKFATDEMRWQELRELAEMRVEQGEMRQEAQQESLPAAEEAHAAAQDEVTRQRAAIARAEQKLQVEQTNRAHAQRTLGTIASRRDRLLQERAALQTPDGAELDLKLEELAELRQRLAEAQAAQTALQHDLPQLETARRESQASLQQAVKESAEAQARRAALTQLQSRVQNSGKSAEWLRRHGLAGQAPLWQRLRVEPGWEAAVEAVLRERLNAIDGRGADPAAWGSDRPGAKLTVLLPGGRVDASVGGDRLLARLRCDAPPADADADEKSAADSGAILADWLRGVRTCPDLATAVARRTELDAGERFVTPGGDLVGANSLSFFAPDASEHGLLERQREIDELAQLIGERQGAVDRAQARLGEIEARLAAAQASLQAGRKEVGELQARAHALQLETLKLQQGMERIHERYAQIDGSVGELAAEEEMEREREFVADEAVEAQRDEVARLQAVSSGARQRFEQAERALRNAREQAAAVERELREAQFSQRECAGKLEEIASNRGLAAGQLARIAGELARAHETASTRQPEELEPQLQAALESRVARERGLAAMREALEAATGALRALEEQRLKIEQSLNPLRDRIGELKLKEQAAGLNAEQAAAQLAEAQADEAALTAALAAERAGVRGGALQGAINSLQKAIEALGAVNLAALEELETARERKGYLDAQSEDLTQAMETLENAIRRIDRETRDLLQSTFDTVNRQFGELFPTLFGGGEARLIMTGEEILDAGVQVMAQPPGKKNSTIHLLSGGEKALTAIALVFAMFQLNPAPFCLLDEVDAPLDDTNTERFCDMVKKMSVQTQFLFISHNKIAMEMAQQLVGVTMQESGVSRIVEVDMQEALRMREQVAA